VTTSVVKLSRRWKLILDLTYAAIVTILLFVVSEVFVETNAGQAARTGTYAFFQWVSPKGWTDELPIIVLNIENLAGGITTPTDRRALLEIIEALSEVHATAIGVDIDFSPTASGFVARRDDPEFFEACLAVSRTTPVHLGVYRTRSFEPETWLGLQRYESLAADLRGPPPGGAETPLVYMWEGNTRLPSLGFAVAEDYVKSRRRDIPTPARWVRPFIEYQEETAPPPSETDAGFRLVNYGQILRMRLESVRATHVQSIHDTWQSFEGKIVIIGDNHTRSHVFSDSFLSPGGGFNPGVFFHASAAYTYAIHPLWELKQWTRSLLDIALAVPFFWLVLLKHYLVRRMPEGDGENSNQWKAAERRVWLFCECVALMLGIILLFELNIMWLELFVAMLVLALHPYLADKLEKLADYLAHRHARSHL
jgi:CHASE2 domain-containing sensor protein